MLDLRSDDLPGSLDIGVCIVGAGPVGIALAVELSRQGLDMVLLESGGRAIDPLLLDLYRSTNVGRQLVFARGGRTPFDTELCLVRLPKLGDGERAAPLVFALPLRACRVQIGRRHNLLMNTHVLRTGSFAIVSPCCVIACSSVSGGALPGVSMRNAPSKR